MHIEYMFSNTKIWYILFNKTLHANKQKYDV